VQDETETCQGPPEKDKRQEETVQGKRTPESKKGELQKKEEVIKMPSIEQQWKDLKKQEAAKKGKSFFKKAVSGAKGAAGDLKKHFSHEETMKRKRQRLESAKLGAQIARAESHTAKYRSKAKSRRQEKAKRLMKAGEIALGGLGFEAPSPKKKRRRKRKSHYPSFDF